MTVDVVYRPQVQEVEVMIGECLHHETESDQIDYGWSDSISGDWNDNWKTVEVCKKCNAVCVDGEWHE